MHDRTMILAILSILALVGLACSEDAEITPSPEALESGIVGGTPTADFEHAVALYEGNSFICSGTLVAPNAVVTAAHCLDTATDPIRVFFGVHALKPWKGTVIPAASYTVHPDWDPVTLANDIAIVILDEESPIEPAPLVPPGEFGQGYVGDKARFVGYGAVAFNGVGAGLKRYVDIELIAVTSKTMRYADVVGNTCYGDSGGGGYVFHDGSWKLVGVTSYGDQWCQHYGVSTRGDAYAGWVTGVLGLENTQPPTATELTVGMSLGGSVGAGEEVYYWLPTFDSKRYDVFVETVSGDVDLYVNDDHTISEAEHDCASTEEAGEAELCTVADGGDDDVWVMVKGNATSLFRVMYVESDPTCHAGVNGEEAYCTEDCPCTVGEGDCAGVEDVCALGLRCMDDAGPLWGLDEGVYACEFPTNPNEGGPLP